jgi:CheY-like chemotaxis protein
MATVLVVDDDEDTRFLLGFILRESGHRVLYAADGDAALKVWEATSLDAVVTDLAMPGLNGLRLIRELRERDPHLPMVAMSGISAEQLDLAQDFGAGEVLFKPVDPGTILPVLERVLSREASGPWARVWD